MSRTHQTFHSGSKISVKYRYGAIPVCRIVFRNLSIPLVIILKKDFLKIIADSNMLLKVLIEEIGLILIGTAFIVP